MSQELTFAVPTLFGVEGLAADELRRLGLDQVRSENGRVFCQGGPLDLPRLNLNLRTGERVLLVLGSFPARDFDALFEGVRALPWERFIPREGQFPVKGHSLNSALHSVPACQSIVKKAVAARLGAKYGLNTLPETGALYQIQFSLMHDEAVLMLDTSGAGLHKRGYRAQGVAAPLRETLAAAMVLLSRYRGRDPLCDPFCGSGTIPIEAALIAKNRASAAPSPPRSGAGWTSSCGSRRRTRPWTRSSTGTMRSGAGTWTPPLWSWPGTTPRWPRWTTWSASTWTTPAPSTGAGCTAGWSPIPPTGALPGLRQGLEQIPRGLEAVPALLPHRV